MYLVAKLFSFADISEINFSKFNGVVRLSKDHRQGKHAEDETDGQADAVVVHQVVHGVLEVGTAGFVDHAVQRFVVTS